MTDSSKQFHFSIQYLNDVLSDTKNIKKKLIPLLNRFQSLSMNQIFQTFNYLYQCLTTPKFHLTYKFNSIFALKVLLDTSNFIVVNWIEIYFLPFLIEAAKNNIRGQQISKQYFLNQGYTKYDDPDIQKYGFNFTLLASQIIQVGALIKPYRLYQTQFLQSQSDFVLAIQQLKKAGYKQTYKMLIYSKPQVVQNIVSKFKQNLNQITQNPDLFTRTYSNFINQKLQQYLNRQNHQNNQQYNLDLIKLLECGDLFVSSSAIQICKGQIKEAKSLTLIHNSIYVLNRLLSAADYQAFFVINNQDLLNQLIVQILKCDMTQRKLKRGQKFLMKFKNPQKSQNLYVDLLDYLVKWSNQCPDFIKKQDNMIEILVNNLKNVSKIQFPKQSNPQLDHKKYKDLSLKNNQRNLRLSQQIKPIQPALKQILPLFEKYVPKTSSQTKYKTIKFCINSDKLSSKRSISGNQVKKDYSLDPVIIEKFEYFIGNDPQTKKKYLLRKQINQSKILKTVWVVELTKDQRYVWRGDVQIDKIDVKNLLMFILAKRQKQNTFDCPSIYINAGSHGGVYGQNANDSGKWHYTDDEIYEATIDTVAQLVEQKKWKLCQQNILRTIGINLVNTSHPCTYPYTADHIIDVQCLGAYQKIQGQKLSHKTSHIKQSDLNFLYPRKPIWQNSKFITN